MPYNRKNLPKKILTIAIILVVIGYIVFNFRIFIAGPSIYVLSPENGSKTNKNLIQVNGKAEQISHISLNNRPILINEKNEFKEFLLLNPGYNIITLEAKDKFGREVIEKIEVVFDGNFVEIDMSSLSATSTLNQSISTEELDSSTTSEEEVDDLESEINNEIQE